jgi:hypothetical protein
MLAMSVGGIKNRYDSENFDDFVLIDIYITKKVSCK